MLEAPPLLEAASLASSSLQTLKRQVFILLGQQPHRGSVRPLRQHPVSGLERLVQGARLAHQHQRSLFLNKLS